MIDDDVNKLVQMIREAESDVDREFRRAFYRLVNETMQKADASPYAKDCLIYFERGLAMLADESNDAQAVKQYLVGALEALRDELHISPTNTIS